MKTITDVKHFTLIDIRNLCEQAEDQVLRDPNTVRGVAHRLGFTGVLLLDEGRKKLFYPENQADAIVREVNTLRYNRKQRKDVGVTRVATPSPSVQGALALTEQKISLPPPAPAAAKASTKQQNTVAPTPEKVTLAVMNAADAAGGSPEYIRDLLRLSRAAEQRA